MSSLASLQASVAAASTATTGDFSTLKNALLALASKLDQNTAAIHASLSSIRSAMVTQAEALTALGGDVDGSVLSSAQAVLVPDFDADVSSSSATLGD